MIFVNLVGNVIDEFSDGFLIRPYPNDLEFYADRKKASLLTKFTVKRHMVLTGKDLYGDHIISETFENAYLNEYSLYFLGMFILGNLVRYHPNIWTHAISHSYTSDLASDDKALALIEKFMDLCLLAIPQMVINLMYAKT